MAKLSTYYAYLDESGDLGFTLDAPFRKGGSSRYLTLSFLLIPEEKRHLPKRIVKSLYTHKKIRTSKEIKGSDLSVDDQIIFANKTVSLLKNHKEIRIFAITVYKKNVETHIRRDANKLYNYMVYLALLNRIKNLPEVVFVPDLRSIKVESGNSLIDYLQTELMFRHNSDTMLINKPMESHKVLNLQFIDWITHIIWKKYEDCQHDSFNILLKNIGLKHLFFPK